MLKTEIHSTTIFDDNVWVTRSSYSGVYVHWRAGGQTYNTSAYCRGQALEIARSHWSERCIRSMAAVEEEINSLLPPQEHNDGDVWVTRSGYSGVYVHWQVGWQSYNTSAHCRGQALEIARSHWSPRCSRPMAKIEEEINSLLPPQEHQDGDVWVTRPSSGGGVYVHWQLGWQSYHTSSYVRGEALALARSRWSERCRRSWEQVEAEINSLLPAQRHKDGDRWIENHGGSWRICWQSGWSEFHQSGYNQAQAEQWLASKQF